MKKILAALGLSLAIATTAQATMFIGLDVIPSESGTTTASYSNSTPDRTYDLNLNDTAFRLKFGAGKIGGSIWQMYYTSYNTDYSEFGYDYIPSFEMMDNLYLNLKLGFLYGYDNNDIAYNQSGFYNVGLKGGLGVSYVLADQFELTAGWDYKYLIWQDIQYSSGFSSVTVSQTSTLSGLYFGASFWFGNAGKNSKKHSNNRPVQHNQPDNSVNSSQKYNSNDQSYNGSSDSAEDVVY